MTNSFNSNYSNAEVRSYSTPTKALNVEDEIKEYEREIERVLQATVNSTERSNQRLENCEQVGVKTLNELLVQREKLENVDKKCDEIAATTYETQRSLNSLKSTIGGFFKNKFLRRPKQASVAATASSSSSKNTVEQFLNGNSNNATTTAAAGGSTLSAESRKTLQAMPHLAALDNQVDKNLDQMASKLSHLSNLGKVMSEEFDGQNELLDRFQPKIEQNNATIRQQDKQINTLL